MKKKSQQMSASDAKYHITGHWESNFHRLWEKIYIPSTFRDNQNIHFLVERFNKSGLLLIFNNNRLGTNG